MTKKRAATAGKLTNAVSMRLSPDDRQLLETVYALSPVVPRLTLARLALRIGLEAIRKDPGRVLR